MDYYSKTASSFHTRYVQQYLSLGKAYMNLIFYKGEYIALIFKCSSTIISEILRNSIRKFDQNSNQKTEYLKNCVVVCFGQQEKLIKLNKGVIRILQKIL